jgi:hypothetical protein
MRDKPATSHGRQRFRARRRATFDLMLFIIIMLVVLMGVVVFVPRRRRKGQPFDWTHRRSWWRPRWAFPDDR